MSSTPKRRPDEDTPPQMRMVNGGPRPPLPSSVPALVQDAYDSNGNRVGVIVEGQFHPLTTTPTEEAGEVPGLAQDLFGEAGRALLQGQMQIADQQYAQHFHHQRDIEREYEGEILGGLRGGIAKFQDGLAYHEQRREQRKQDLQAWSGLGQRYTDHLLTVMDTHAEIQQATLRGGLDQHLLNQREAEMMLEARTEVYGQTQELEHHLEMKRLEVEALREQRADERAEAALVREHDLVSRTFAMGEQLPGILTELRLLEKEQPAEQVVAAMKVVEQALVAFGSMGQQLEAKDRENLAPLVNKIVGNAINESMKVIKRGAK